MPGLTDGERSLDRLAKAAKDRGAEGFGGGPLFLMPAAQAVFLPFLQENFPALAPAYRARFEKSAYLERSYKDGLAARVRRVRDRYGLTSGPMEYRPEIWVKEEQPTLFEL